MTSLDFKTTGSRRLLQLAEHLETGQLGHEEFYFGNWNTTRGAGESFDERGCGTVGCAIGECPIVWPNEWQFDVNRYPYLRAGHDGITPTDDAARFFGISHAESRSLFLPTVVRAWGDRPLGIYATREKVAESIRQFVTWKLQQGERDQ